MSNEIVSFEELFEEVLKNNEFIEKDNKIFEKTRTLDVNKVIINGQEHSQQITIIQQIKYLGEVLELNEDNSTKEINSYAIRISNEYNKSIKSMIVNINVPEDIIKIINKLS